MIIAPIFHPKFLTLSLLLLTLPFKIDSTPVPSDPPTKHPSPGDFFAILIDTPNDMAWYAPLRLDGLWHYFKETPCFPHRTNTVFASEGSTDGYNIPCDQIAPDIVNLTNTPGGRCVWKRKNDGVNVYVVPGVSWKVDIPDRSAWTDVCCGEVCY